MDVTCIATDPNRPAKVKDWRAADPRIGGIPARTVNDDSSPMADAWVRHVAFRWRIHWDDAAQSTATPYAVEPVPPPRSHRMRVGRIQMRGRSAGHAQDQVMYERRAAGTGVCSPKTRQTREVVRTSSGACIALRDHAITPTAPAGGPGQCRRVALPQPPYPKGLSPQGSLFPAKPLPAKPHDLATRRAGTRGGAALGASSGGAQGCPVRSSI